ncbi:hypothetical protein FGG33_gp08 [Mycobacterium phage Benedict]|uniref:Uncharacterized protein n=1 Tax=Mycobacterium phage Benedict TaxID=2902890 RepID=G1EDN6_9CAUD|nr:hypothetical protein FGG33_gp08 [Mycobacterium phage Benedict]AEJ93428.1 hypothetical protein BENEDICT_89 [Mycobacterium phage Benedict]
MTLTANYGSCEYWRQMDKKFGTDKRSPLHHDNRCTATSHSKAQA